MVWPSGIPLPGDGYKHRGSGQTTLRRVLGEERARRAELGEYDPVAEVTESEEEKEEDRGAYLIGWTEGECSPFVAVVPYLLSYRGKSPC